MERCHLFAWFSLLMYSIMVYLLLVYFFEFNADIPSLVIMFVFIIPYVISVIETLISPCGVNRYCQMFNWIYIVTYIVMFLTMIIIIELYDIDLLSIVYMMLLIVPYLLLKLETVSECSLE